MKYRLRIGRFDSGWLALAVILSVVGSANAFDRAQEHADRLGTVNLKARGAAVSYSKGPVDLSTDLGDTPISESVAPARFYQDNSSVAYHKSGVWLAAWRDERQGSSKIYLESVDFTGTPTGENILLAGSVDGADYVEPRLAVDTAGHVHVFFRDRTNGLILSRVYYDFRAAPVSELLVNDTGSNSFAGPFDAAVYPDGKTVIVWENYSLDSASIALKIFNANGSVLLPQTTVNSGRATVSRWVPSVAEDPTGGFVVAWEDYRNGQADIYARLFNAGGTPLGTDFALVPPPADLAEQYAPRVAFSSVDKFLIGWIDNRNGSAVYVQRYDLLLGRVGENRVISPSDPTTVNWNLSLTVSPAGRFAASWASFGARNEIVATKFAAEAVPMGTPSRVNSSDVGRRWEPCVTYSPAYRLGIGWTEATDDDPDIHFQLLDSSLGTLAAEAMLNDDSLGAPSISPVGVSTTNWWNLVVFVDERSDAGDIYLQTIANNGSKSAGNVRVSQDNGRSLQSEPAVASGAARALVVWVDARDVGGVPGHRIFGRFGSVWGTFSENEFIVSDPTETAVKGCPKVAINSAGRCLVTWLDTRDGTPAVYGRWFAAGGLPNGSEFTISSPATDSLNADLQIAVDGSDRFYAIWLERGGAAPVVKARWFQADGASGGTFAWTPALSGVVVDDIAAAVNTAGDVSLLWTGLGSSAGMYLTVLDRSGSVTVPSFAVTDYPSAVASGPALSIDRSGYHSAVWLDENSRLAMFQIYTNRLEKVGVNRPVSQSNPQFMRSPAAWADGGRAWFTWVDPRANGLTVYAANVVYLSTDVSEGDQGVLPAAYILQQNHPNPFNPSTEIRFSLPYRAELSLAVYNLLGRQVRALAGGVFASGSHSVTWDGRDDSGSPCASGVYFYRLQAAGFSQTKKMVLLK